jgi:hypothetical protein
MIEYGVARIFDNHTIFIIAYPRVRAIPIEPLKLHKIIYIVCQVKNNTIYGGGNHCKNCIVVFETIEDTIQAG